MSYETIRHWTSRMIRSWEQHSDEAREEVVRGFGALALLCKAQTGVGDFPEALLAAEKAAHIRTSVAPKTETEWRNLCASTSSETQRMLDGDVQALFGLWVLCSSGEKSWLIFAGGGLTGRALCQVFAVLLGAQTGGVNCLAGWSWSGCLAPRGISDVLSNSNLLMKTFSRCRWEELAVPITRIAEVWRRLGGGAG